MDGFIKKGSVVRVNPLANLPEDQLQYRDRLALVVEDSEPDDLVLLDFREGNVHEFQRDVLHLHLSVDDPSYIKIKAYGAVYFSSPKARAASSARGKANMANLDSRKKAEISKRVWSDTVKGSRRRDQLRERIRKQAALRFQQLEPLYLQVKDTIEKKPHLTRRQVAQIHNCPEGWVDFVVKHYHLQKRKQAPHLTADQRAQIQELLRQQKEKRTLEGAIYQRIAELVGASYMQVQWIAQHMGIVFKSDWTMPRIRGYFREIESLLPSLSDADLLNLLRSVGVLPVLQFKAKGNIAEMLRLLRAGELNSFSEVDEDDSFVDDEETKESDYESLEPEIDPALADRLKKTTGITQETIERIIEGQLAAMRAKWFRDGTSAGVTSLFQRRTSGKSFQEISARFAEEVNAVESLSTPWWRLHKNSKPLPPSPMQKYVALMLKKNQVYGNWSGTGAGKTDSAGLAAYVIGSELTVVLTTNSTILGWKKQLEETFPGCRVYTKITDVRRGPGTFLILNYERFQSGHRGAHVLADKVVALNPDFIVLDEIQMIKQRGGAEASNRSLVIRNMLLQLPKAHVLGMSATPVINELREGISLLEAIQRKPSSLKSRATVANALDLFADLRHIGVRYIPKYEQTEETLKIHIQRDDLLSELLGTKDILPIEQTLLPAKLEAIKDRIKPGTLLYLEYVEGMVSRVRAFVESLGFTVGEYVGETDTLERETVKNEFIAGGIDVLIGSRAIGVGVDGLQERCDQLILLSLPWTHAAFTQVVGRVYRQGGRDTVQVIIPQVIVSSNGERWSWDEGRLKHLESKRTLAECATDGVVPTTTNLSRKVLAQKAIQALTRLEKRLENHA